ncbi:hypothetical protein QAD02_002220 [Eretmocerus hayati]|uniref:Uncharacterized protein n=1 Tax=Eretmocerus hayati TaxID=131215 RepID=A0ACC2NK15_9HYME|nr:hypothetical protein QAD02_002220 [Eretmocerus hayati]
MPSGTNITMAGDRRAKKYGSWSRGRYFLVGNERLLPSIENMPRLLLPSSRGEWNSGEYVPLSQHDPSRTSRMLRTRQSDSLDRTSRISWTPVMDHQTKMSRILQTVRATPVKPARAASRATVAVKDAQPLPVSISMPNNHIIDDELRVTRITDWLASQVTEIASVTRVGSDTEPGSPPRKRECHSPDSTTTDVVYERSLAPSPNRASQLGGPTSAPQGCDSAELSSLARQALSKGAHSPQRRETQERPQGSPRHFEHSSSTARLRPGLITLSPQGRPRHHSSTSRDSDDAHSDSSYNALRLRQAAAALQRWRDVIIVTDDSDSAEEETSNRRSRCRPHGRQPRPSRRPQRTPSTITQTHSSASELRAARSAQQTNSSDDSDHSLDRFIVLESDPSIASEPYAARAVSVHQDTHPVPVVTLQDSSDAESVVCVFQGLLAQLEPCDVSTVSAASVDSGLGSINMNDETLMSLVRAYFASGRGESEYNDMMSSFRSDRRTRDDRERKRRERADARANRQRPRPPSQRQDSPAQLDDTAVPVGSASGAPVEEPDQPLDLAPSSARRQVPIQGEIMPPAPRPLLARPIPRRIAEALSGHAASSTSAPSTQPAIRVETYELPEVSAGAPQVVQVRDQHLMSSINYNAAIVQTPETPAWARSPGAAAIGATLTDLDDQQHQVPMDDFEDIFGSATA